MSQRNTFGWSKVVRSGLVWLLAFGSNGWCHFRCIAFISFRIRFCTLFALRLTCHIRIFQTIPFFSEFIHFNAVLESSTLFICPSVCIVCNAFVSKRILFEQQWFSHMPTAHIGVWHVEFHQEHAFPKRFNENGFQLEIHVLFGDQLKNFAFEMPTKNWLNSFGPPRFEFN